MEASQTIWGIHVGIAIAHVIEVLTIVLTMLEQNAGKAWMDAKTTAKALAEPINERKV